MANLSLCGRPAGHMGSEADVDYIAEVREDCRLAGRPELAVSYIERMVPIADVLDDMIETAIGFRSPRSRARQIAPFRGLFDDEAGESAELDQ